MSRTQRFRYCCIALGLVAMSMLACNSDAGKRVPGGQTCEQMDQCEGGWACYQGVCRQICNDHRECAKTEACQSDVCVPVANYECDEDADCNEPSECQSILDAECYAGQCHYSPVEEGSDCDDDNQCTRNDACDSAGTCSGEAVVCDTPPGDFCSQDDTVFHRYESIGTCNPWQGSCEYDYDDIGCTDCRYECLGLPYAPANLVATAGDALVTLTWEAIDGALSYNVYVSETDGETASAEPVSAASSPYEHTGLSNGMTYYFAVAAVVEAGEGDLSDKVSATPHISAPKGVNAQGGDQQVTLTWDEVPGADTYNVYWATTPDVSLGSNQESKVTSPFVHTQLDSNTTYYYAVTAVDEPSESVLSDEVSATTSITQEAWIGAPSGVTSPLYGTSVALSGDYAIVGVYYDNGGADHSLSGAGAAYVFQRTDGTWDAGTRLEAPSPQAGAYFGKSVALSGDYAIVGANMEDGGDDDSLSDAGAAYVFRHRGNTWDMAAKLEAPVPQAGAYFGKSVALSGDYAIVGAPSKNVTTLSGAGAAYVFQRTNMTWDIETELVAFYPQAGARFGTSVALSGDYAIVGADGEDRGSGGALRDAGAAYVFQCEDGTWNSIERLVAPAAQKGANFGNSVGLDGDCAIVGASLEGGSDSGGYFGAAYVFQDGAWDTATKLVAPEDQETSLFGYSVALRGDYAMVGAPREGNEMGAAYWFHRTDGTWDTGTKLVVAPDAHSCDSFGFSVALGGDYGIVASRGYFGQPFYLVIYAY